MCIQKHLPSLRWRQLCCLAICVKCKKPFYTFDKKGSRNWNNLQFLCVNTFSPDMYQVKSGAILGQNNCIICIKSYSFQWDFVL
ncbi:hypothetical protein FKM82_029015 [Ascaphus truei]